MLLGHEIKAPAAYPIQPKDINTNAHFWEAFGKHQVESAARWVVMFCQKNGDWHAFTKEDMEKFYNHYGHRDFPLHWLALVVLGPDGKYRVTHEFVARCFLSSPAVPLNQVEVL